MKFRNSALPFLTFVALIAACSSSDQSGDNSAAGATSSAGSAASQAGAGGSTSGVSGSTSSGAGRSGAGGASAGSSSAGSSNGGAAPGGGAANGGGQSAGAFNGGAGGGNLAGATGRGGAGGTSGGSGNAGRGGASSGGNSGKGGASGGGSAGSTGMSGAGNAGSTSCSFPSNWTPGSATYTTYTLPNPATACGYTGTNNNIANIAVGGNYAAIPGMSSSNFDTSSRCGACVQIGNAIITIVDECPYDNGQNVPCNNNKTGHLDLSATGASAANVTGNPDTKGQNQWKFVPCPINGNVMVRLKNGNNNEVYIENEILPIASVTCDGQTGSRQSYGAWHFANDINGKGCTVTDISNRTINVTVGNSQGQNVNSGVQFPKCN